MPSVVFDIETIGSSWNGLHDRQQEYLLKGAETEEEQEHAKGMLALWAPTAQIVTIALMNPTSKKGKVYFQTNGTHVDEFEEDGAEYVTGSEKDILEHFWRDITRFDHFITFNGRCFDGPMLMMRSAMLGVRCTRNLVPYRYDYKIHCDLLDQLTFYGATRKFNLDFYTQAFGIKSPKEEGITGDQVSHLFEDGRHLDIARYCWRDVQATAHLWKYWDDFIKC